MVFGAASRSIFNTNVRCWRIISLSSHSPRYPSLYRGFCYAQPSAETLISDFYRVRSEPNRETRWKLNSKLRHTLFDPRLNDYTRALVNEEIERHDNKDKDDLCDPEHKYWQVSIRGRPDPKLSRDDLIDSYINILARAVGSEEEAKKKIYVVSTAFDFSFGAVLPEKEFRDKLEELPEVEFVSPVDSRGRERNGQPFVNGKAARYYPFYYLIFPRCTTNSKPEEIELDQECFRYNPQIEESSRPCIEDDEDLNNPKHEYWRVSMRNSPDKTQKKDQIINSYVNILAQVVGSEEEAKKRIFIVSAFFEFYFGALLPEKELRDELEELPEVGSLVPLGIKGRSRGEPFINGKAGSEDYGSKYYLEFTRPGTPYFRRLPAPTKREQKFRIVSPHPRQKITDIHQMITHIHQKVTHLRQKINKALNSDV